MFLKTYCAVSVARRLRYPEARHRVVNQMNHLSPKGRDEWISTVAVRIMSLNCQFSLVWPLLIYAMQHLITNCLR